MVSLEEIVNSNEIGALASDIMNDLEDSTDPEYEPKKKLLDKVDIAVEKVSAEANRTYDSLLKRKKPHSYAAKSAKDAINSYKHINTHPRLLAEKDIYDLREAYRLKLAGEPYYSLLYSIPRKCYNDYWEAKKVFSSTLTQIIKALLLHNITSGRPIEWGSKALEETKDPELLTYHLIYLLDQKEDKAKIKSKFRRYVELYCESEKTEIGCDELVQKLEEQEYGLLFNDDVKSFLYSSFNNNDLFRYIMLKKYFERFGDQAKVLETQKIAAYTFENEPWLIYDYLQNVISPDFLKEAFKAKKWEDIGRLDIHFKTAVHMFKTIPRKFREGTPEPIERNIARYNKNKGDFYYKFATKLEDFKKALEAYDSAKKILEKISAGHGSDQELIKEQRKHLENRIKDVSSCKRDAELVEMFLDSKPEDIISADWDIFKEYFEKLEKKLTELTDPHVYLRKLECKTFKWFDAYIEKTKRDLEKDTMQIHGNEAELESGSPRKHVYKTVRENALKVEKVKARYDFVRSKIENMFGKIDEKRKKYLKHLNNVIEGLEKSKNG